MKFLALALLSLVSVSSYANTVKCNILAYDQDKRFIPVDSFMLGEVSPGQVVYEASREIPGSDNIFVSASLLSTRMNLAIFKDAPDRYDGTELSLVMGESKGLALISRRDGVSINCSEI